MLQPVLPVQTVRQVVHSQVALTPPLVPKFLFAFPLIYPAIPLLYTYTHTGCGRVWVTDGIWKLTFPHCMMQKKVIIQLTSYPCVIKGKYTAISVL